MLKVDHTSVNSPYPELQLYRVATDHARFLDCQAKLIPTTKGYSRPEISGDESSHEVSIGQKEVLPGFEPGTSEEYFDG